MNDDWTDLRCDACWEIKADHIYRGDIGLTHCPEHPEVELRPIEYWDGVEYPGFGTRVKVTT